MVPKDNDDSEVVPRDQSEYGNIWRRNSVIPMTYYLFSQKTDVDDILARPF